MFYIETICLDRGVHIHEEVTAQHYLGLYLFREDQKYHVRVVITISSTFKTNASMERYMKQLKRFTRSQNIKF